MIPNEHGKTRKTHVLITFVNRWVSREFAVIPTLVRYLRRNDLVRNFAKAFRETKGTYMDEISSNTDGIAWCAMAPRILVFETSICRV